DERLGANLLDGRKPDAFTDPMRLAVVRGRDELAVVGLLGPPRRSLTLVLDDRDDSLRRESSADSWRAWLRLANLAQGEPHGDTLRMTTKSLVEAGVDVGSDEARAPRVPSAEEPAATVGGMPSWTGPAPDAGLEDEPAAPEATALPAD